MIYYADLHILGFFLLGVFPPILSKETSELVLLTLLAVLGIVTCRGRNRKPLVRYPKDSQFWATDFYVKGCKNFIDKCPKSYKYQHICARSYDGDYKNFPNYCFMQYENCNSWRNWYVFKREKC